MGFLSKLMPREGQFFVLFNQHATHVVDGGRALTLAYAAALPAGALVAARPRTLRARALAGARE